MIYEVVLASDNGNLAVQCNISDLETEEIFISCASERYVPESSKPSEDSSKL